MTNKEKVLRKLDEVIEHNQKSMTSEQWNQLVPLLEAIRALPNNRFDDMGLILRDGKHAITGKEILVATFRKQI